MLAPASAPKTVPAGRSASRSSRALPTNRSRYCRDSVVGRYSDFGRARQRRPPFPTAAPDFPPMRMIAHLSDLHFGRIDERVVTALLADLASAPPNLIVISGDLTQRAKNSQFAAARRFLDALPSPFLVIPVNHHLLPLWHHRSRTPPTWDRHRSHVTPDLGPTY